MKKKADSVYEIDESLLISNEPGPDNNHSKNEIRDLITREIEKLPERYRICLDFYFFFGLKYKEISNITGYPVNTIKSDVLRAKNILRQNLKGTIAEDYNEM